MPHCSMIGGAPPVITYLGTGLGPFAIGDARPDRMIVVFDFNESDASAALASVTIGGIAATLINNPTMPDPMGAAFAVVPTGTTVSISKTGGGGGGGQEVYMITGLVNNAVFHSATTGGAGPILTVATITPSGFSVVLAAARSRTSNGVYTVNAGGTIAGTGVVGNQGNFGGGSSPSRIVASASASSAGAAPISLIGAGSYSTGYAFAASFH